MGKKFVVIIQCQLAHNKCSGFACTDSFYNKNGKFDVHDEDVKYLSFTCGGCCGKGVSAKLMHFSEKLLKKTDLKKEDVMVHLASCISTDNFHYDRCPHIDYMKKIIGKRGFDIVEGSYISKGADKKREKGIYESY